MPTISITAGHSSTGLTISCGTILDVLAGGTPISTTISNGRSRSPATP